MEWVRGENEKTVSVLEKDSRYAALYQQALTIAQAKDRIPAPNMLEGQIFNFWQDGNHEHGIWRHASLPDYQGAAPQWRTVLDLDALSKAEKGNWFWKGAVCQEPQEQRCMVSLSDGGEDAVTLREFDLSKGGFVDAGFSLPSGKQDVAWADADSLLVSREWKSGEVTRSGYAFVVKRVKRGEPLDAGVEVFRGSPDDVGVTPFTAATAAVPFAPNPLDQLNLLPGRSFMVSLTVGYAPKR